MPGGGRRVEEKHLPPLHHPISKLIRCYDEVTLHRRFPTGPEVMSTIVPDLSWPETHTQRQTTQPDCLPSLLCNGYKWIEIVYGVEKNNVLGRLEQQLARQYKNLLYQHDKLNEPTKEGPVSIVLFASPFTSVSTVGTRQGPTLSSLSGLDLLVVC